MTNFETVLQETKVWLSDPLARELAIVQRAQKRGLVRMLEPYRRAIENADGPGIQFYGEKLEQYKQVLRQVALVLTDLPSPDLPETPRVLPVSPPQLAQPQLPTYVVSPMTLATAYTQLIKTQPDTNEEPEWMLAVTGVKHEQLRTLEHLLEIKLAKQSATAAAFDMQDFAQVAITLHEQGQAFHAIFHSHRFNGPPHPSAVDWRLQDILDQGGYPTIQAVFSEDGYIRFFARRPFLLSVSGKGVECVDANNFLYQIKNRHALPGPRDATQSAEGGARPVSTHRRRQSTSLNADTH